MNLVQTTDGHRVGRKSAAPSAECLAWRRITPAKNRRLIRPTLLVELEAILAEFGAEVEG